MKIYIRAQQARGVECSGAVAVRACVCDSARRPASPPCLRSPPSLSCAPLPPFFSSSSHSRASLPLSAAAPCACRCLLFLFAMATVAASAGHHPALSSALVRLSFPCLPLFVLPPLESLDWFDSSDPPELRLSVMCRLCFVCREMEARWLLLQDSVAIVSPLFVRLKSLSVPTMDMGVYPPSGRVVNFNAVLPPSLNP